MRLFLKVFYDATVAMSASYESTVVNFYHHLIKITNIFLQYAFVDTLARILFAIREKNLKILEYFAYYIWFSCNNRPVVKGSLSS